MPLYRVPENAPLFIAGDRRKAGDLIVMLAPAAEYEVSLGHLVEVDPQAFAEPAHLTDDERAALPPLGDGPVEYATGQGRMSEGSGEPMIAVPAEPDGAGGYVGHLTDA